MSMIEEYILERAKYSPMAWTLKCETDKQNLCEFVKGFMLDAIYDANIQKQLMEEKTNDN